MEGLEMMKRRLNAFATFSENADDLRVSSFGENLDAER